ncbi:insulinase family protein [Clostridium botulinum]|uniref:M16 family metallopeptidase n=1 Tax=Clostridium botulinum TaxID=1491 RepID=UPI0001F84D99|nr:pitrilysin family protein [Clostridium botulinum]NFB16320.1 insulinase family protein [Clostridium botulinum]NFB67206.1 insulinase family protein [Clostridium botulinum]NFB96795.1 insulinase family protein [Clostridium botulinum]NFC48285.1 insulinase family protein [Clostridium botulinum]NFC57494.1 insulinase family protein [Clostridium botulinum]
MYNLFTLDNGLRVVLENIDYVKSVSVGLWIENGSRNENLKNNGISHFIEHMMFKGTENRSALQIAECIEDVGGQINAFTGKEATCYYIKILNSHIELALEVLSDMLFNSKFKEEDIEKEKGVIIEEISMTEDSPEDVLSDLHCKAIWGDDSISYPILGTVETVKSFKRKDIVDYINKYYIPENSVISICGNFDINELEKLINKYFGNWNSSENKNITVYSKPKIENNHLFKNKNIEQLHISLGFEGLELGNDDAYPLILLSNVLGGGASSILFQKIREEKGLCYSIYSYMSSFNKTGAVSIYTGLNPAYTEDTITLIKQVVNDFSKEGINKEKLIKSKEQLKGSYILGLESTSTRMFNNGKSVLFLNRINDPEIIMKKIDKITEDKLQEIMDRTFRAGIKNSAFVGEKLNLENVKNILDRNQRAFKEAKSKLI